MQIQAHQSILAHLIFWYESEQHFFFSTRNKDDNHGDDDDGYGHIMIMMNIIKIEIFFICKKFIYPIFVWSLNFQLNHQCECDSYK